MWWIIIIVVIVILVALGMYGKKNQPNNQNKINPGAVLYKTLTGRDYDKTLDPYPNIPLQKGYSEDNIVPDLTDITDILVKFMYGDIYLSFLRGVQFSVSDKLIRKYCDALIDTNRGRGWESSLDIRGISIYDLVKSVEDTIRSLVKNVCQQTLNKRVSAMNSQYAYKYCVGKVTPKTDIEKVELDIYVANHPDIKKNAEKELYSNEDMVRIKQILATIPPKINEINNFNNQLQNTISEYEEKAIKTIEVAYASALTNSNFSRYQYFKSFDRISQRYSSEVNPVVAATVDASVKKVAAFINQKQDIINKNNADIAKYNQLMVKLQKQYDDEFALQKIKELNRDVNSQMEDMSDVENKEIKNSEIHSIISDIDILDKEVNERRQYEIQFGQIEI